MEKVWTCLFFLTLFVSVYVIISRGDKRDDKTFWN